MLYLPTSTVGRVVALLGGFLCSPKITPFSTLLPDDRRDEFPIPLIEQAASRAGGAGGTVTKGTNAGGRQHEDEEHEDIVVHSCGRRSKYPRIANHGVLKNRGRYASSVFVLAQGSSDEDDTNPKDRPKIQQSQSWLSDEEIVEFERAKHVGEFRKPIHSHAPEPGSYTMGPGNLIGAGYREKETTAVVSALLSSSGDVTVLEENEKDITDRAGEVDSEEPHEDSHELLVVSTGATEAKIAHCQKLTQHATTWVKCHPSDVLPRAVHRMLYELGKSDCSAVDWATAQVILLLSEDIANSIERIEALDFPSGRDLLFSGDTSLLFLMDCLRARLYAAGVDGQHLHRIDTYETAGRKREELYGKKPTIVLQDDDDLDPSGSFSGEGDTTKLPSGIVDVDTTREIMSKSGQWQPTSSSRRNDKPQAEQVLSEVVRLDDAGEDGGMVDGGGHGRGSTTTGSKKGKKKSFSIQYHGDHVAKETLEYYIDKQLEEREAESLPYINKAHCRTCAIEDDRKTGVQIRAAVVYVVLNLDNNGPEILKDLLLAFHCADKHLKFPNSYDILVLHHAFREEELYWLQMHAPHHIREKMKLVPLKDEHVLEGDADGKYGCRCPAWAPRCWDITWMRATRIFTDHMFYYLSGGNYDYFMRLDSDFFFVAQPEFDAIKMLAENKCAFGYHRLSIEAPGCFDDFERYVHDFAAKLKVKKEEYMLSEGGRHFYATSEDPASAATTPLTSSSPSALNSSIGEKPVLKGDSKEWNIRMGHGVAAAGGQWTVGDMRLFGSAVYQHFSRGAKDGVFQNRWADQLLFAAATIVFGNRQFCFHPMFQNATLFVHKKQGYKDVTLWEKCEVEHQMNFTAVLEGYPHLVAAGGELEL
ncbi:unnamed protein product [Amoebophrya sp. A25]|nr:unnamed protein product [Amoebophrya sp. A25]|eukprot:GSA25T00016425001.1